MTSITYLYTFTIIFVITGILWTGLSCYRIFVNEGGNGLSKALWSRLFIGLAFIVPISIMVFMAINVLATQKHFNEQLDIALNEFATQSELHYDTAHTLRLCAKDDLNRLFSGARLYDAIECLKLNQLNLNLANLTNGSNADKQNTIQNKLIRELRSPGGMAVVEKINALDEKLNTLVVFMLFLLGLMFLLIFAILIECLP